MPIERPADGFAHTNRAGEASVQSGGPFASRDRTTAVEMHDLACSMNTGVSSACSEALHRPMRIKLCDGGLQHGLNAATVALALPATK